MNGIKFLMDLKIFSKPFTKRKLYENGKRYGRSDKYGMYWEVCQKENNKEALYAISFSER